MEQQDEPRRYVFRRKRAMAWTADEVLALRVNGEGESGKGEAGRNSHRAIRTAHLHGIV